MAQVAQAPAYGGLRQGSYERSRTASQDEEEVVSVRCASWLFLAQPVNARGELLNPALASEDIH